MPSALISVKDSSGANVNIEKPIIPGQATMADSRPVVIASNQSAVPISGTVTANVGTGTMPVSGTVTVNGVPTTAADRGTGVATANTLRVVLVDGQTETGKYEAFPNTVSTTTMLGSTGAVGDFLSTVTIVPETLNPGSISIKDGSGTAIVIFAGGTGSVLSLIPFTVNLGYTSTGVGWQIVTGSGGNVHGVCGGNFT